MLVITFPTTTTAMAMDAACGPGDGRLIPIPRELSGGCGLAWCAEPERESGLTILMGEHGIPYEEKQVLILQQ